MKVTKVESPLVTPNELNGIIYKLKNDLKIDPIKGKHVVPSSIKDGIGTASILVNWDSLEYNAVGSETDLPWVQLSFPKGYIFPTAYSMRGVYKDENTGYIFATSWDVFGIKEGDEKDENKWELLATNTSSESTYCEKTFYFIFGGYFCQDNRTGTFTLKPIQSTEGFKHIRWRLKTSSCNDFAFATSGIDVYGTLFTVPRILKKTVYCRCSSHSRIFVVLSVSLMNK